MEGEENVEIRAKGKKKSKKGPKGGANKKVKQNKYDQIQVLCLTKFWAICWIMSKQEEGVDNSFDEG